MRLLRCHPFDGNNLRPPGATIHTEVGIAPLPWRLVLVVRAHAKHPLQLLQRPWPRPLVRDQHEQQGRGLALQPRLPIMAGGGEDPDLGVDDRHESEHLAPLGCPSREHLGRRSRGDGHDQRSPRATASSRFDRVGAGAWASPSPLPTMRPRWCRRAPAHACPLASRATSLATCSCSGSSPQIARGLRPWTSVA